MRPLLTKDPITSNSISLRLDSTLDSLLRTTPLDRDAAWMLVGQVVAWLQTPNSAESRATVDDVLSGRTRIAGREFEDLVRNVEADGERPLSHLLLSLHGRLPYEYIEADALRNLALFAQGALDSSPREFAEALVQWRADNLIHVGFGPPREIGSTMLSLIETSEGEEVYCLGPGAETVAIECMRRSRIPILMSRSPPLSAAVYTAVTRDPISFVPQDFLSVSAAEYFQLHGRRATLAVPPFGMKRPEGTSYQWRDSGLALRTSEAVAVEAVDESAATRAVILVPNGVLSRPGSEQQLRERLAEQGHVEGVISFPPGLLSSTAMPFSLLLLDTRARSDGVLVAVVPDDHIQRTYGKLKHRDRKFTGEAQLVEMFRSARSPTGHVLPRARVAEMDYSLNANRLLNAVAESAAARSADRRSLVAIEDLVTIIKPQAWRAADVGVLIGEVSPGELPDFDFLTTAPRHRLIAESDLKRLGHQRLEAGDVLLSTKGTIGRTGIARPDPSETGIYPSQSNLILRLNPRGPIQDPVVLLMFLRSPYFMKRLKSLVAGSTIPNVAITDLRKLMLRVPTLPEQQILREAFETQQGLQRQIGALTAKRQAHVSKTWEATGLEDEVSP